MDARSQVLGRAHQRLEIDVSGYVGVARTLQGVGEAVPLDRLKRVTGIAADVAIVDYQRGAVLIADARRDLHDFSIRAPLEHRADRGGAHQRWQ